MEKSTRIIMDILKDKELLKGGITEADKELQELGFTEKQAGEIQRRLRNIALKINKKVDKD